MQVDAGAFPERCVDDAYDLLFLDSERSEYVAWWPDLRRTIRGGGLFVVDNAPSHPHELAPLVDLLKADPAWLTYTVPVGKGELLASKARNGRPIAGSPASPGSAGWKRDSCWPGGGEGVVSRSWFFACSHPARGLGRRPFDSAEVGPRGGRRRYAGQYGAWDCWPQLSNSKVVFSSRFGVHGRAMSPLNPAFHSCWSISSADCVVTPSIGVAAY